MLLDFIFLFFFFYPVDEFGSGCEVVFVLLRLVFQP